MLIFNKTYFGFTIFIFLTEVLIAFYVHDSFVRPYMGDVLVVILLYCFFKSFLRLPVLTVAISVLIFAFTIELLQFFNIVEKLNLRHSKMARTVIGTSFSWIDLLCYAAGIVIVIGVERYRRKKQIISR
jgi:hypothetical protein